MAFISAYERELRDEAAERDFFGEVVDAAVGALEDLSNEVASIESLRGDAEGFGWKRSSLILDAMLTALERQYGISLKYGPEDVA